MICQPPPKKKNHFECSVQQSRISSPFFCTYWSFDQIFWGGARGSWPARWETTFEPLRRRASVDVGHFNIRSPKKSHLTVLCDICFGLPQSSRQSVSTPFGPLCKWLNANLTVILSECVRRRRGKGRRRRQTNVTWRALFKRRGLLFRTTEEKVSVQHSTTTSSFPATFPPAPTSNKNGRCAPATAREQNTTMQHFK